jgi:hypothetical protein
MNGQALETTEERDMGVAVSANLKLAAQCFKAVGPLKQFWDELEGPSVTEVDKSSSSHTSSMYATN